LCGFELPFELVDLRLPLLHIEAAARVAFEQRRHLGKARAGEF
jgi:hypothetical protein